MTSYEDIEEIIEEWFSDYARDGNVSVAKLYAYIDKLIEKNLRYYLNENRSEQE